MKIKDFYLLPEQKQAAIVLNVKHNFKLLYIDMDLSHSVALSKTRKLLGLSQVVIWHIFKHDLEIQKIYNSKPKQDRRGLATRAREV